MEVLTPVDEEERETCIDQLIEAIQKQPCKFCSVHYESVSVFNLLSSLLKAQLQLGTVSYQIKHFLCNCEQR